MIRRPAFLASLAALAAFLPAGCPPAPSIEPLVFGPFGPLKPYDEALGPIPGGSKVVIIDIDIPAPALVVLLDGVQRNLGRVIDHDGLDGADLELSVPSSIAVGMHKFDLFEGNSRAATFTFFVP